MRLTRIDSSVSIKVPSTDNASSPTANVFRTSQYLRFSGFFSSCSFGRNEAKKSSLCKQMSCTLEFFRNIKYTTTFSIHQGGVVLSSQITPTQSSNTHPLAHIPSTCAMIFSSCAFLTVPQPHHVTASPYQTPFQVIITPFHFLSRLFCIVRANILLKKI